METPHVQNAKVLLQCSGFISKKRIVQATPGLSFVSVHRHPLAMVLEPIKKENQMYIYIMYVGKTIPI